MRAGKASKYLRLCEENGVIWHSEMVEKQVGGEFLSRILETHFRVVFYDVFGGCEVTKMQSSHLNSHRRPHSAPGRYQAAFDFST